MNDFVSRLKKSSKLSSPEILSKSKFFNEKDMIQTSIPMLNVALSGKIDGGLTPGLTMICGPSKHFKSGISLILAKAYMDKYPEAALLFYDSEFGTPASYFISFGIDTEKVLHCPVTDVEQLKIDIINQLDTLKRDDKIIIIIDSIGNLASKKEVDDAMNEKTVADMSRAKGIKSLFRMITPHLTIKDIPMVVINHSYMEIGMFPKQIPSGGTGGIYSSDTILMMGRQQEKTGNEISGYNFILNVEKSRYVKEKSKIPLEISYEDGISKWSGLLETALELKFVLKPSNGWYQKIDVESGEVLEKKYREADTNSEEFWKDILSSQKFKELIANKFSVAGSNKKPII